MKEYVWETDNDLAKKYGAHWCQVGAYCGHPDFNMCRGRVKVSVVWAEGDEEEESSGKYAEECMRMLAMRRWGEESDHMYAISRLALIRATDALEIATENYMAIAREYIDNGGDIDDVPGYHLAVQVIKGI